MQSFHGTAAITDIGVKKHFKNFEPVKAIFELVWNGFDANARTLEVNTHYNDMDGLDFIEILDDGDGIDLENLESSFEKFNESTKKNNDDKHGSQGKGRLAFHVMCGSACWYTKKNNYNAKISIEADSIRDYDGTYLDKDEQYPTLTDSVSGTCVVLSQFNKKVPLEQELSSKLSKEFGWYLALNTDRKILLNGKMVEIPKHELHRKTVYINNVDFNISVLRWDDKPSSEKSHNYLVEDGNRIISKYLSKTNNKVSFYTSAYAFSPWFESYDPELLDLDPVAQNNNKTIRSLLERMTEFQREIYGDYLRKFVDEEIERFDDRGYFPAYSGVDEEYAEWRKSNTKKVIKDIYLADPQVFNRLSAKPAKVLIRLLDKVLVSNENDTILEVLDGVLDLNTQSINKLAQQLKKTTFENIVSTIEILQRRQQAIHQLREVMDCRFSEVLETPDLQKIIESNTWLFGPQYTTLGAEEDSFTSIAKNLRDKVKDIDIVSDTDIENGLTIDGVNRQVDLFLARKIPAFNGKGEHVYKCVIVEIKRPGISLNKKHLQQVDDYCEIIAKHPSFASSKMFFEIILIGRKISKDDFQIKQRMNNLKDKAEFGLVTYDDKIKCYVKDWYTIFDEFDLSNNYLLDRLNIKLDDLSQESTEDLVTNLQEKSA
ncbi:ATP-binding protein [Vibrio parahaemolyticus O5:K30]|nr:ATP-binding protein [Vibrio parahaemolyticus O5:K30]ELA9213010.1 ATP-binding protein [Vibrio parahaemolyticus]ELZ1716752.1 ATP-binding protein [Vibrio parahaemolyticus]